MEIVYDLFDLPMPLVAPDEKRLSKRLHYGDKPEKKKYKFLWK